MPVLVAHPNANARAVLARTLAGWGVSAVPAHSAASALEILERASSSRPFACAIVDAGLPDHGGWALASAIRGRAEFAGLRIVLLASKHLRMGPLETGQSGATVCLPKPVRPSRLFQALEGMAGLHPAGQLPPQLNRAGGGAPCPVLVAEDNVVNQKVAQRMLAKLGYDSHVAGTGQEALEAIAGGAYCLVLMDCQMPGMDGFEAASAIRGLEGGERRTPIVAITANSMEGDRERCLAAGMDDYLSKPFRLDELSAVLDRWAKPAQARGAVPAERTDSRVTSNSGSAK